MNTKNQMTPMIQIQTEFPVLYDNYRQKLIDVLCGKRWIDTLSDVLVELQKEDSQREVVYKSGNLGRLAIVEWEESMNISPKVIQEIEKIREIFWIDQEE